MDRHANSAFTLIEVLLVVVIIGILAGMLVVNLAGRSEEARVARARADLSGQLMMALDLFEQDVGRYPSTEEGLQALVANPGVSGWKRPYLRGGLRDDPWGTPYSYALDPDDPTQYRIRSAGPDHTLDTSDDVGTGGDQQ